ncbi:MAG: amylo-alpha-1,6-glucosidase [Acidobacteriota bacterium]|nr:amylo-alpha-1,6-glucosidase [Acidobacteriota bacterium]
MKSRRGPFTEWLVTNGLGGYASGTIGGFNTRRFHGWLIAALPAPHGRTMMANSLLEKFYSSGVCYVLTCEDVVAPAVVQQESERSDPLTPESDQSNPYLQDFRLESGLPVWQFRLGDALLEKRVCMVHKQNTTYLTYTLLEGKGKLEVKPALHIRPHEGAVGGPAHHQYRLVAVERGFELFVSNDLPTLKFCWKGEENGFRMESQQIPSVPYRVEQSRGYDWQGDLWSPGIFSAELDAGKPASLTLSTEDWERVNALTPATAFSSELERRRRLLLRAGSGEYQEGFVAELVMAADQFLITPVGRVSDQVRAQAVGDEVRSVIAGYHWFTDWGRDTMISLEGLTLSTGRWREAEYILRTFADYIYHGLIPNMFPEGKTAGLYHTADATLWFFHAIDRYVTITRDIETLRYLMPKLLEVVRCHLRGTDFGIGVDPADGLLRQGAVGYQLTWMDAKVGDWVVTPRRGKAVEINALWYNALRLMVEWLELVGGSVPIKDDLTKQASLSYSSFQNRFWNQQQNCLYDVVDSLEEKDGALVEAKDDPSIRPNQILAISLRYPVLAENKWRAVVEVVKRELLTPVGLRSLSPGDPEYKPSYDGDLQARDAAYHQGTVWAWLIGPLIDSWLRVYPEYTQQARGFLRGFEDHLYEDGVGTISEIFDAEPPFTPRGCMAQAWSVAEVLRTTLLLNSKLPSKSRTAVSVSLES